ncbi:hypothetical protein M622_14995 [Thauera terpenica 58Eu]|uniref:Uncharacterized protein n=1 Tax=Thauera terpenica 58Eu TaxID=1348657 RepID=T0AS81_9RHOO|nr:hypothetical protein M622_14995 [Thauera terpenica 58Eu]
MLQEAFHQHRLEHTQPAVRLGQAAITRQHAAFEQAMTHCKGRTQHDDC